MAFILLVGLLASVRSCNCHFVANRSTSEYLEQSPKLLLEDTFMRIIEGKDDIVSQYFCDDSNDDTPKCSLPWTYCNNGTCQCGDIPQDVMQCHIDTNSTILNGYCITYDEAELINEEGICIYSSRTGTGSTVAERLNIMLSRNVTMLTETLCGPFNRTGTLCGKCKDGYYPLAYSYDMSCVECQDGKSNWWKFMLAAFLPLTAFYFIILYFEINITSSNLHGFVFCSQGVAFPALAREILLTIRHRREIETAIRCIGSFFAIWNLDFFRFIDLGICLPTSTLTVLALDAAVGIYPLLLMVLTYILIELHDRRIKLVVTLWKPFLAVFSLFRNNWEIKTSLIDAFTTFFLLSSIKFVSVASDSLVPTIVYQLNSTTGHLTQSWRLYYDPTMTYFGKQHLPYAILAISVLTIFVILPGMLLFLNPFRCFQKFINLFPIRWYILHTFMDLFQGCYKDGTEPGTRDCRWFASVFFIARVCYAVIGALTLNVMFFPMMSTIMIMLVISLVTVQPFKTSMRHYSEMNSLFFLLLALWYVSLFGISLNEWNNLLVMKPLIVTGLSVPLLGLLYMLVIVSHWVYSHRKFGQNIIRRLQAWRHGYEMLE